MNYRNILKVIGGLLLLLSLCQVACLGYSFLNRQDPGEAEAARALGISVILCTVAGGIGVFLGRHTRRDLLRKEAIAAVGLGWTVCSLFGAFPYLFAQPGLGFVDALFESMSGFTTTGASVISDLTGISNGLLLWRAVTQWLGGMGILVLFVALLSSFRIGSRAIFRHESSAQDTGGIANRASELALRLWVIYIGLSVACLLGFKLLGMSLFDAVCHAFATVSTGGFSTHNQSIAHFNSLPIELWTMLFMVLGGINFILYAWLLKKRWEKWRQDEESKAFLAVLLIATIVIGLDLTLVGTDESILHAFRVAAFQVISIMTTSGFVTSDFGKWPPLSDLILLLLMVIGGCAGSTAGGVKLSRWILFFKSIKVQLSAAFRPNRIISLRLNGRPVSDALRLDTLFFVGISGVIVMLGTIAVSFMEPKLDMDTSVSAVLATLFNIGPGLGAVGPTSNFADLAPYTKLLLTLLMAIGRLEFYAILALFLPSLWRNY